MSRQGSKSITYRDPPQASDEDNTLLLDDRLVTAPTRRTVVAPGARATTLLSTPFQRYSTNLTDTVTSSPDGPTDVTNTAGTTPTQTTSGTFAVTTTALSVHKKKALMTLAPKKRSIANKRRGVDQLSWFSSVTMDRDRSSGPVERIDDDDDDDYSQAEGERSGSRSRPTSRAPSQSGWSGRSMSRLRSLTRITTASISERRSRSASPMPDDDRDLEAPQDLAEEYVRLLLRVLRADSD